MIHIYVAHPVVKAGFTIECPYSKEDAQQAHGHHSAELWNEVRSNADAHTESRSGEEITCFARSFCPFCAWQLPRPITWFRSTVSGCSPGNPCMSRTARVSCQRGRRCVSSAVFC